MIYNKTRGVEYVQKTFRVSKEIVIRLDEYSIRTGVTRTFAVEEALREYLDKKEGQIGKGGAIVAR